MARSEKNNYEPIRRKDTVRGDFEDRSDREERKKAFRKEKHLRRDAKRYTFEEDR